jgi:hypothetical protein
MLPVPMPGVPAEYVLWRRQLTRIALRRRMLLEPGEHLLIEVGPERLGPAANALAQRPSEADRAVEPSLGGLFNDAPRIVGQDDRGLAVLDRLRHVARQVHVVVLYDDISVRVPTVCDPGQTECRHLAAVPVPCASHRVLYCAASAK